MKVCIYVYDITVFLFGSLLLWGEKPAAWAHCVFGPSEFHCFYSIQ